MILKFIIALLFGIITFSPNARAQEPEDVALEHLNTFYALNLPKAYEYISTNDKAVITLEQYQESHAEMLQIPLARELFKLSTCKVISIKKAGTKATVNVERIIPNYTEIVTRLYSKNEEKIMTESQLKKALDELNWNDPIPTKTMTETLELVKEKDGWKIFYGWQAKMDKTRENMAEELTYIKDKIRIYDFVRIKHGVRFNIENRGNKTITNLEVMVFFKDTLGKIIHKKRYFVITSPSSAKKRKVQPTLPLQPNQIWQMPVSSAFPIPNTNDWETASARVSHLEFEE